MVLAHHKTWDQPNVNSCLVLVKKSDVQSKALFLNRLNLRQKQAFTTNLVVRSKTWATYSHQTM